MPAVVVEEEEEVELEIVEQNLVMGTLVACPSPHLPLPCPLLDCQASLLPPLLLL